MKAVIERTNHFLNLPLDPAPRGLLLSAAVLIAVTAFLPMWRVTTFGPDGPRSGSSSYELLAPESTVQGDPVGPREVPTDFPEFKWVRFAFGVLGLLFLRTAALGTTGMLVDVSVVFVYLAAFVFWSFASRFSRYGESGPGLGAYAVAAIVLLLAGALLLAWRQGRSELNSEARMAG